MSSIFDHPLISDRYFFPRRDPLPNTFWVESGDVRLACYQYAPHQDGMTLVHFHGNGEVVADYLGMVHDQIINLGLNVCFGEYRGYGRSSGHPAMNGMLDDVDAILNALDVDPARIVLFGRSVGSIYAIHAAAQCPEVAGLIIESGIADPLERILLRVDPAELGLSSAALTAAASPRLDHRKKLTAYPGPLLVMHAEDDSLVPIDNARRIAEWAAGPVRVKFFPSGDHNAIMPVNWHDYWHEVATFVNNL